MAHDLASTFVPVLIFSVPIIAIVGGIASRIVRTMARARIQELMIQERIRSIEKGIIPTTGPSPLATGDGPRAPDWLGPDLLGEMDRSTASHRVFGLRLAGAMLFAIAGAIMFSLYQSGAGDGYVWMSLPMAIGMVLIIGSFFVPGQKPGGAGPGTGPAPGPGAGS